MASSYTQALMDELIEFLLSAPTLEQVIAFHPSIEMQLRLRYLLDGNRNNTLKDAEKEELDEFLRIEHFARRLKIRALKKLQKQK
jgi:hypothetical protein